MGRIRVKAVSEPVRPGERCLKYFSIWASLVFNTRATLQWCASLGDGSSSLAVLECLFPLGKGLSPDWSIWWFSVRWSMTMPLGTQIRPSYKSIALGRILTMYWTRCWISHYLFSNVFILMILLPATFPLAFFCDKSKS